MTRAADPERILESVSALVVDTGGTLFDWHTTVHRALEQLCAERDVSADWPAVTKTWRSAW